jgi:hypothetical protein
VPAAGALDPDEIARPQILDASGVERDQRRASILSHKPDRRVGLSAGGLIRYFWMGWVCVILCALEAPR